MKRGNVKAHIIYNPAAGPWDARKSLKRVRSYLRRHGWSVEIKVTEKPGDATALARDAAAVGCDVAIAAGGDGTVSEAVNGLVGTQTALAVLPAGTGNIWARQLNLSSHTLVNPLRLREIAAGLAEGTVRPVDVGQAIGQANDRYFLCWAGIGLDAQVTAEMEPRDRYTKRLGALPYAVASILVARDFQGVRTRVTLDGGVVRTRTLLVLASNIQHYMGSFNLAADARVDDGLLDVFIFKGLGFPYAVRHVLKIVRQRCLQDPRIVHRRAQHIEVQTEWATLVQMDGDPIGTTPIELRVVPQALRILTPPSAPSCLFTPITEGGEK